ncbi:type II secretion system protein GspL [Magnetofaba australis]|uniref:Putative general secretion pathway protein L n=1 Tax=Magnetofaba australis IT-1 TaxID=1434232 RepID=A0A1Y2K7M3_9PROT|nr:type II secretion system protein GspL [Magnetofaba australis]OSM05327.1 putative general secretion pathway protein L [Magnetofaba australis IT-1]
MAETFVIRFDDADPDLLHWRSGAQGASGSCAEAAQALGGARPVWALSAFDATLLWGRFPKTSRRNLEKAVPFHFEDRLAAPVEQLHFALAAAPDAEQAWAVGVILAESLSAGLGKLRSAGVSPRAAVSELQLLAPQEGAWRVVLDETRALARFSDRQAVAVDPANLPALLMLGEKGVDAQPQSVEILDCRHLSGHGESDALRSEVEAALTSWSAPPTLHWRSSDESLLANLTQSCPLSFDLNFLQGPFSTRKSVSFAAWRPLKLTAALAAGWLALLAAQALWDGWKLQGEAERLAQQSERIFQQTFPNSRLVDAKVQMSQGLNALRAGGKQSDDDLLGILGQVGAVTAEARGVRLSRVRLEGKSLNLYLTARAVADVDALRGRLAASTGRETKVVTASQSQGQVVAQLRVAP